MTSPAPGRATGSLTIAFGLISVPVAVFAGVEGEAAKIKRNMRVDDGHAVKFLTADGETGEIVSRADTYMVYTTDDGTEVPLSDNEIAAALGSEHGEAEIVGFYPIDQIGRYENSNLMQVRPKNPKGKAKPFDKPFALLIYAMKETSTFALLRFTLRGVPSYGTLTSDGFLRTVRWDEEIRDALPLPEADLSEAEVGLAVQLIQTLAGTEAPVLGNDAVEKVREYAKTKASGVVKPATEAAKPESLDNLLGLLAASMKVAS